MVVKNMNNMFYICDKLNSVFKQCYSLFSFKFNNNNYLVYTYSDDGYIYYLLVSKIMINSFGKFFLMDISNDERTFLSNFIYDFVINLPINFYHGLNGLSLIEEYCRNNSIKLLNNVHIDNEQPIFINSLIASSNWTSIDMTRNYYSFIYNNFGYLNFYSNEKNNLSTNNVDESNIIIPITDNKNINGSNSVQFNNNPNENIEVNVSRSIDTCIEKNNHFAMKEKNAGFASSKYIIIGTICLFLASFVVFFSIILIKNL